MLDIEVFFLFSVTTATFSFCLIKGDGCFLVELQESFSETSPVVHPINPSPGILIAFCNAFHFFATTSYCPVGQALIVFIFVEPKVSISLFTSSPSSSKFLYQHPYNVGFAYNSTMLHCAHADYVYQLHTTQ